MSVVWKYVVNQKARLPPFCVGFISMFVEHTYRVAFLGKHCVAAGEMPVSVGYLEICKG